MTAKDLQNMVLSLVQDIEFSYKNIDGSICPFTRKNIEVSYGETYFNFTSVEDLMKTTFLNGEALQDVCDNIIIY